MQWLYCCSNLKVLWSNIREYLGWLTGFVCGCLLRWNNVKRWHTFISARQSLFAPPRLHLRRCERVWGLWLRPLVFVIHPALLRALFQCHGILLDECITSPRSRHVCTCLYMFGGLASIFGRGQLLSSVASPEGRTPTALHRRLIWGGSAACHSLARTSWSLPAWLCWKDKAHCRVDLEKHVGVASIGKGLGVFIISTNPFQTGKRGEKFYLRECSGVFVCSRI